ncbi:MAG: pilus assembly protein [Acidobacteriales bacterium]|nr:pilus assembly protein [Terriglobales bacterium]
MRRNSASKSVERQRARRGGAMLESVFVLLTFLALIIGIFDIGQMLFLHETLVERARNACRYGAVRCVDPLVVQNLVMFGQPWTPEGKTTGIFGLTRSMVTVTRENVGTTEDRYVVKISNYPFLMLSPWLAGRYTGRSIVASMSTEAP